MPVSQQDIQLTTGFNITYQRREAHNSTVHAGMNHTKDITCTNCVEYMSSSAPRCIQTIQRTYKNLCLAMSHLTQPHV